MKKLLGIVVLGLLLSGNAYAEKVMLSCKPQDKKNKPVSFILDDKNKNLVFEGTEFLNEKSDINGLMYNEHRITFIWKGIVELDRITGALEISSISIDIKDKYYSCKKVKKTKF